MPSVLIIDDDGAVRGLMRQALETAGYDVRVAAGGRHGLHVFRSSPTDLVITDLYMPDYDGLEVIARLRRGRPQLKILAISGGSGTMDYLPLAKTSGATRVLHKPFDMQSLLETISDLLSHSDGVPDSS